MRGVSSRGIGRSLRWVGLNGWREGLQLTDSKILVQGMHGTTDRTNLIWLALGDILQPH